MAQRSQKSGVSLITEEVKKEARVQCKPSFDTFYCLIAKHYGSDLRLNEVSGRPEVRDHGRKCWREWTDEDQDRAGGYFERHFGIWNERKLAMAFRTYFSDHRVNPVTEMLDRLEWDGKPRIEQFLHRVMKAEDTPYTRECSRLIFAGGVHRAYRPGCKFDEMIVLIGPQGGGKSTLVRWLNMDEDFFREIRTITGKEGVEALLGTWIGEVSELMALTRARETEAVKAFISGQEDSYRTPYSRYTQLIPRRCVFIGTTNNPQFLSDRTGNRRFYPVECFTTGKALRENEEEIRQEIAQAWAEAVYLYRQGDLLPCAREEVRNEIVRAQENAKEDDWREGAICQYLEDAKKAYNATVCVIELWHRALGWPADIKPARRDSLEIAQIMNSLPGWIRNTVAARTPWGLQKVWRKDNTCPLWRN